MTQEPTTRIAAVSDIHVTEHARGKYQPLFAEISQKADMLILCGDLTDHGIPEEAKILTEELQVCSIPKLAVLGNHDYESDRQDEVKKILRDANIMLLAEEKFVINDIGFTGVKGFAGGFGRHMLGSFGETAIKDFVKAAINEAELLEVGLGEIEHTAKKVVAMHYSPIVDTIINEAIEIYPFLGSSRFEEVINRFDVSVVFHGHAHFGSLQGKTQKGIPVFNVSYPLLQTANLQYKLFKL